jgi:hypothetical protein
VDDVGAVAPPLEQQRNDLRRILQVGVHVDDRLASGRRHSRQHPFRDAKPPRHVENLDSRVSFSLGQQ